MMLGTMIVVGYLTVWLSSFEDGKMFGEEYTLVSVADYVLSKTPGNTVSNLSSTCAPHDA